MVCTNLQSVCSENAFLFLLNLQVCLEFANFACLQEASNFKAYCFGAEFKLFSQMIYKLLNFKHTPQNLVPVWCKFVVNSRQISSVMVAITHFCVIVRNM